MKNRRVPLMLQSSPADCGATCLAMILAYHGRYTAVQACRDLCGAGRDGTNAASLLKAARLEGLSAKALASPPVALAGQSLPAIAYWNSSHFVVVEECSAKSVTIVDPAVGRRDISYEEFAAGYADVLLTFARGPNFERRSRLDRFRRTSYAARLLGTPGIPGLLAQMGFSSVLLQLLGLATPLLTKVVIDGVLPLRLTSAMHVIGLGIVIWILAGLSTTYLRSVLILHLKARLDTQTTLAFFVHLLQLPYEFFQQHAKGDLLMRMSGNAMIRELLTNQTISAVLDGVLILVYLGLLVRADLSFGLAVCAIAVMQIGILAAGFRRAQFLMQRDLVASGESQSCLVESLSGIATLKAFGAEDRAFKRWSELFSKSLAISLERTHLAGSIDSIMGAVRMAASLVLLWLSANRVLNGSTTLGSALALNALAASALAPLASLIASAQQLQLMGVQLDRIIEVLDAEPEQAASHTLLPPPRLTGLIELQGLGFRYGRNAPWVLRGIDLRIEPGQKVALVGKTGSGKSTLAMLLLGLYTPSEGEIRFDGVPMHHYDLRALRQQFGVVLQEPNLFSGSIHANIALNDPALTRSNVIEAAQVASIHEEILQMPMGYETPIGEGGGGLSGGQRQRLSIARAVVRRPSILLLDEATSHLDLATERTVHESLGLLAQSTIVIAHRLSTVRDADLIVVLDHGAIVERGTHEQLLGCEGHYYELIKYPEAAARAA